MEDNVILFDTFTQFHFHDNEWQDLYLIYRIGTDEERKKDA